MFHPKRGKGLFICNCAHCHFKFAQGLPWLHLFDLFLSFLSLSLCYRLRAINFPTTRLTLAISALSEGEWKARLEFVPTNKSQFRWSKFHEHKISVQSKKSLLWSCYFKCWRVCVCVWLGNKTGNRTFFEILIFCLIISAASGWNIKKVSLRFHFAFLFRFLFLSPLLHHTQVFEQKVKILRPLF